VCSSPETLQWHTVSVTKHIVPVSHRANPSPDAPQIFSLVGAGQDKLLITGFFGVVKVVSCLFFLLFLIERIGRRGSLLLGSTLMGSYFLIVAVLTKTNPPNPNAGLTPASIASLTMIYLEAMSYNISWGPVPWVYTGEIFPTRIREGGVAISTATQWMFNCVFSLATPYAVRNLGWRTFLMFSIFNYSLFAFVWFFIKETKGLSLEEMEDCKLTLGSRAFLYRITNKLQCLADIRSLLTQKQSGLRFRTRQFGVTMTGRTHRQPFHHDVQRHKSSQSYVSAMFQLIHLYIANSMISR
jgi:hypothetical protein